MHYEEFRAAWDHALRRGRVISFHDRPEETIDIATMDRRYRVRVGLGAQPGPEPFTTSMLLKWEWDALISARFVTCEEDLLTQVLGPRPRKRIATDQPWLRVDVELAGMLPMDRPIRIPSAEAWRGWVDQTMGSVDPLLPALKAKLSPRGLPIVESWLGEPEADVAIRPDGDLRLSGVTLRAWQAIKLPRHWDDPERKPDAHPQKQLESFAKRLHDSLEDWKRCLKLLVAMPESAGRVLH